MRPPPEPPAATTAPSPGNPGPRVPNLCRGCPPLSVVNPKKLRDGFCGNQTAPPGHIFGGYPPPQPFVLHPPMTHTHAHTHLASAGVIPACSPMSVAAKIKPTSPGMAYPSLCKHFLLTCNSHKHPTRCWRIGDASARGVNGSQKEDPPLGTLFGVTLEPSSCILTVVHRPPPSGCTHTHRGARRVDGEDLEVAGVDAENGAHPQVLRRDPALHPWNNGATGGGGGAVRMTQSRNGGRGWGYPPSPFCGFFLKTTSTKQKGGRGGLIEPPPTLWVGRGGCWEIPYLLAEFNSCQPCSPLRRSLERGGPEKRLFR